MHRNMVPVQKKKGKKGQIWLCIYAAFSSKGGCLVSDTLFLCTIDESLDVSGQAEQVPYLACFH